MIQNTTQANALFSALQTNYYVKVAGDKINAFMDSVSYNGCKCVISPTCVRLAPFYRYPNAASLFDVPGFYIGCYVLDSLLQSTLICFYSQSCLNELTFHISPSVPMNITALDASLSTQYSVNSTIQELVDHLMIEEWNVSTMYETYYNECQPTQCSYTIETRNNIIYIVTTLFGIAGGLTTVLKLVVPRFVTFVIYCIRKQRTRVAPGTVAVQT
jgi:hypothetical protein